MGASGAIAAVMGAYFRFYPHARVETIIPPFVLGPTFTLPAVLFLGWWFLIQFLQGAMSLASRGGVSGVAWWAHVGGFVFGFVICLMAAKRPKRHFDGGMGMRPRNVNRGGKAVLVAIIASGWVGLTCQPCHGASEPCPARIDYVVPSLTQPHATNTAVIWYDDFDSDRTAAYLEPEPKSSEASLSATEALGWRGQSMECFYGYTTHGRGNRKLVFGDSPIGKPLRKGEKFPCVYWRIYVKHERGWQGAPDKLSRATGIVSTGWNQAFIAHVWGAGQMLTLDPATAVVGGEVTSSGYNDFAHLRWLGNQPAGAFPLHESTESGRWVCVEAMVRVNTPGHKDGAMALWVDGKLDAERTGLDLRGSYTGTGQHGKCNLSGGLLECGSSAGPVPLV